MGRRKIPSAPLDYRPGQFSSDAKRSLWTGCVPQAPAFKAEASLFFIPVLFRLYRDVPVGILLFLGKDNQEDAVFIGSLDSLLIDGPRNRKGSVKGPIGSFDLKEVSSSAPLINVLSPERSGYFPGP